MLTNKIAKHFIVIIFASLFAGITGCKKDLQPVTAEQPDNKIKHAEAKTGISLATLFRNSYQVYELQRNAKGVYRDSKLFSGTDYHPCSVANIGMGLVSLCIADKMSWITNAGQLARTTLQTVLGYDTTFHLAKNVAGFPRHFVDMQTGVQAWNSEFSTIDAAIMVSGALFCKKYFASDTTISRLADTLYNSINWSKAIADPVAGTMYLSLDSMGNGLSTTSVYNEYMLVANLAYNAENGAGGNATTLWNNFFVNPDNMPKSNYWGYSLLTDYPGSFLSDFIPQFCYYLCHPYNTGTRYLTYMNNSMLADKKWWTFTSGLGAYEWGLGAGSAPSGYHADGEDNNPDKVVSPHIIAGFMPVNSASQNDLLSLYNANKGVYTLPGSTNKILWRYSVTSPSWTANEVQGVDFSSMLFGLASLPAHCGTAFFTNNNDYIFPRYSFLPR
ncbi:hypothetical protein QTN47_22490 [Danxiaibacter flavus]|uniref:Glycoamylase-like domain-containing protein n=1 Tax=Danxiaibacter flavus TaxID=3049108 RepID=A0ABV3ZK84_9BACT|nr:hypothetical protein QNM32_22495 [Chitinophagaceae bacterium DXS]